MRILITRPIEDGEGTARLLGKMGHQSVLAPLLTTHFFDGPALELENVRAILVTSANGVRALARRTQRRDVAIFAVGEKTARQAISAGFSHVRNAQGNSKSLIDAVLNWSTPDQGSLLHVCGREAPETLVHALSQKGFRVRRSALYEAKAATQMPLVGQQALRERSLDRVLFYSPRSAQIFCKLIADLPTQDLIAICISKATALALATLTFADVRSASAPNQRAMFATLE